MAVNWKWGGQIKNKGDEGFNNAGILTFNSHAINSFVRELFQNSNDAKIEGQTQIRISIENKKIKKSLIPNFSEFKKIYEAVRASHPQQKKFFIKADQALKGDEISMLVYSDYNTNGLVGNDFESNTSFSALVLSEGISAKENNNAGGSYGIGKNAIYGVSSLRTVFYSSRNKQDESIFQGVSKLASYSMSGNKYEGRIYLGNGEKMLSVRGNEQIPEVYQRHEPGLSQYVLGVDLDSNWVEHFTRAILRNYWMLLVEKGLEVTLLQDGKVLLEINAVNTAGLMEELFKNEIDEFNLAPYGNPYFFYLAYINGEKINVDVPFIGKCIFYYLESEQGENNIAYTRNGMVIYSKIEKRLVGATVTGVFKCDSDEGNAILRKMEPPKHDCFEPQMLEDNHEEYSIQDGTKIIKTIKDKIREIIKSTVKKYSKETETPPFLTELFEDLNTSIANGHNGKRENKKSETETIYRKAVDDEIKIQLFSDTDNVYVSSLKGLEKSTGAGSTGGTGPIGIKNSKTKGGQASSGGSSKRGASPKYSISSRVYFFKRNEKNNIYKCVLHSDQELGYIELSLSQYADSGSDVSFLLVGCYDINYKEIKYFEKKDKDGLVDEYKILLNINEGKNVFMIEVSDIQKSAFIINA